MMSMMDLREIYSRTGVGACIISGGRVVDAYLLSDNEKDVAEELAPLTLYFPENFRFAVLEAGDLRFGVVKIRDVYLLMPVRTANYFEFFRTIEVKLHDLLRG